MEESPVPTPADIVEACAHVMRFLGSEGSRGRFTSLLHYSLSELGMMHKEDRRDWPVTDQLSAMRWEVALAEAVNRLVSAGSVVPAGEGQMAPHSVDVGLKGRVKTGRTRFPDLSVRCPADFRLSTRAADHPDGEYLFDPDRYLSRLNLDDPHPRVERALREAVAAYRSDVYLAAATMLGSASEGAWKQLIAAYDDWARVGSRGKPFDLDPDVGKLPSAAEEFAERRARAKGPLREVAKRASVHPRKLYIRFDHLRDIRNFAAHFDTSGRYELNYPSMTALLLVSAEYFPAIYRLRLQLKKEAGQ